MYANGETAKHAKHANTVTAMDFRAIPVLSPTGGEALDYDPNRLRPRLVGLFLSRVSRVSRFDWIVTPKLDGLGVAWRGEGVGPLLAERSERDRKQECGLDLFTGSTELSTPSPSGPAPSRCGCGDFGSCSHGIHNLFHVNKMWNVFVDVWRCRPIVAAVH